MEMIEKGETVKAILRHLGIAGEEYLLPAEKSIVDVIKAMPGWPNASFTELKSVPRRKVHSKTYLSGWGKKELAEHARSLEQEYNSLNELYERVANINLRLVDELRKISPESLDELMERL